MQEAVDTILRCGGEATTFNRFIRCTLKEEGVFINVDDGVSKPLYLPWAEGDPNGRRVENGIAINIARFGLNCLSIINVLQEQREHHAKPEQVCGLWGAVPVLLLLLSP